MTVLAIDGPAGAGKSTVARSVAKRLGWRYVDTGALYRAVGLAAVTRGIDVTDGPAVGRLARSLSIETTDEGLLLDGEDVSRRIREPRVTAAASAVAAHPEVRSALIGLQRSVADSNDVVLEGRDIGSVVFPDAAVKVFLTASLQERARRRALELGVVEEGTRAQLEQSIAARDQADSQRAVAPLKMADGAVVVDTTGKDIDTVTGEIVALVREATSAP